MRKLTFFLDLLLASALALQLWAVLSYPNRFTVPALVFGVACSALYLAYTRNHE